MTSLTDDQKRDGWVEHDGGPMPVAPETIITAVGPDPYRDHFDGPARLNNWARTVAYKPEQDHANG